MVPSQGPRRNAWHHLFPNMISGTGRDGGKGDNESDLDVAKQIAMQMAGKYLFRNDDGSVDKRPDGHKLAAYVAVNRDPNELFRIARSKGGNITAYRALQWLAAVYANFAPDEPMPDAVRLFLWWSVDNPPPAKGSNRRLNRNHDMAAVTVTRDRIQERTVLPLYGGAEAGTPTIMMVIADAFGKTEAWVLMALKEEAKQAGKKL